MRTFFVEIPGIPIPQQRPRLSKRGVFDPQSKEKKVIKHTIYLQTKQITEPFKHPEVSFIFLMPIVNAVKDKLPSNNFFLRHEKKPDIDNLVKLYLDCLDGNLFFGDQQVSLGYCEKFYSKTPSTFIKIEEKPPYKAKDASFLHNFLELKKQNTQQIYCYYDSKFHADLKDRLSVGKFSFENATLPSF